jgi:hypothetical protein
MRPPQAPPPLAPQVEDLFRRLPRAGAPEPGTGHWVQGRAGSRREGTEILFHLQFRADGTVSDVRFQAFGCPHTLATTAWVAEQLSGRPGEDLSPGSPLDWAAALAVPVPKLGRLLRIEDALRDATKNFVAHGMLPARGAT